MAELLYVGMAGGIEDRIVRPWIPLLRLRLRTPDSPANTARTILDFLFGMVRCLATLRKFSPQVLFSTGGFVSVPATLAALVLRRPVVIFLPDVSPGTTIRLLCRMAKRVAVSLEDSLAFLPDRTKAVVTGYPVRSAFRSTDRNTARSKAGLAENELQLLVIGGSLGAATINRSVSLGLDRLLHLARVVHVCGHLHIEEMTQVQDYLDSELRDRYQLKASLTAEEMADAMFASDLAITRGGASILGELPAAGLPAIVVPLPAARVGQAQNAMALERSNASVTISNHQAEGGELVVAAEALLKNHNLRHSMGQAMSELQRPKAAEDIARIVTETALRGA